MLAVIVGFYGSQAKHVAKYSSVYRTQIPGINNVLALPCNGNVLGMISGGLFDGKHLAKEICKQPQTDIIFHVLSNRGMLVYLSTLLFLPQNVRVRGVVFDSCPGSLAPYLFFKATAANQVQPLKRNFYLSLPFFIVSGAALKIGVATTLLGLLLMEIQTQIVTYLFHRTVSQACSNCPVLFLYSLADDLVSARDVEKVIDLRRQRALGSNTVFVKRWDQSAHVKHLVENEAEYVQELLQFVTLHVVRA